MQTNPMQRKLRILVLKHLAECPLAGYGLTKKIHECTGWKPSYGSIYPLLDQLKQEGLVTIEENGKKKIHHLTPKGREEIKEMHDHQDDMAEQMRERLKLMSHIMGFDDKRHDEMIELFFTAAQKGEKPFKEVIEPTAKLKITFWKLYQHNLIKKHKKEIKETIEEANRRLERLLPAEARE